MARGYAVSPPQAGRFVPKPSIGRDGQRCSTYGLRQIVCGCPLVSTVGGGDCYSLSYSPWSGRRDFVLDKNPVFEPCSRQSRYLIPRQSGGRGGC
jgi:hypothetical protein